MPKNEKYFFQTLSKIVGLENLKSKSIGVKVSSMDVHLDKDYNQNRFPDQINSILSSLLAKLRCSDPVGTGSLSHHLDGLFIDHPIYGTRIIEFDEEQHFNTFRVASLVKLSSVLDSPFVSQYQDLCKNPIYFNMMLKQHRLKVRVESVPATIDSFIDLIKNYATPNNGYIKPKTGFDYIGGRIAQRAYYDTLRDVIHLSELNNTFSPPIRMSTFEFEKETGLSFSQIPQKKLQHLIENRLETYG